MSVVLPEEPLPPQPNSVQQFRMSEYIQALEDSGSHTFSRGVIGAIPDTIVRWRKQWPQFDELCEIAHARGTGQYTKLIADAARGQGVFAEKEPNLNAAMFLAARLDPELRTGTAFVNIGKGGERAILITTVPLPRPVDELPEET